jgi:uncharacterized protein YfaS (alpha-2-macroglobulin family)
MGLPDPSPRRSLCSPAALAALCLLAALLCGCGSGGDQGAGVELIPSTQEISPATTFELRFDEPIAAADSIGAEATVSPLVFRPGLRGRFVWTSARSGVFTPEEPMRLGADYELCLASGLKKADGQAARARLQRVIHTPPFGMATFHGPSPSIDASSEPEFRLWFNAEVRPWVVTPRAGFVDADGKWIAAVARQGTEEDGAEDYEFGSISRQMTWQAAFDAQRHGQVPRRNLRESLEDRLTNEVGNLVVVTPAQPLSVGRNWRLVIDSHVPSADGRYQSKDRFEARIGDVREFRLEQFAMHHVVYSEPYLNLDFSKQPDSALTNTFTNWVRISPWPDGVTASFYGAKLNLSGGWQRGTRYTVTLRRGLPAAEAFALGAPETFEVEVPPVDPRLYFPQFSTEQLAGGNRSFPLLAVNVPRVRVRAKLLEAPTAIHALRGYESYAESSSHWRHRFLGDEFNRLDYNLVPGRTIYSDEITCSNQPDAAEEIKLDWDRLLKGRRTGIVFLEAERIAEGAEPVLGTQALIQLTDLGLLWKAGVGQLQAVVFSYETGRPVTNALVRVYSDENELLGEASTDSAGAATLALNTNAVWVAAQAGDDLHAVRLAENNIPMWLFHLPQRWRGEEPETRRVAFFTDRDVYRPGESANLKVIARDLEAFGLKIPAGRTGMIFCVDARSKRFFETNVTLNALGSWNTAIPLPSGPNGECQVTLALDGAEYFKSILLADYQPAPFEIKFEPKAAYAPGEKIDLPISARYLFGKALSRARVHWSLSAEDHPLQPEGFEGFSFARSEGEARWGREPTAFTTSGEGQIIGGGDCRIRAEVPPNPQAPHPRQVSLLVEITDADQQTLTRSAEFVQHSSKFYLGLKSSEEVLEAGKELPAEIAAVGADGAPWTNAVRAHITLRRIEYHNLRVQGAGRTARYRNECVATIVLEKDVTVSPAVKVPNGEKGFRGSPLEGIAPAEAGEYLLEASALDDAGRETACSVDFNVAEKAAVGWNYRNEVELKLVPDKPSYRAGETAVLLAEAPFSGTAWVTVERENVRRCFEIQLEGNAPSIRVPVEPGDAPNIFVSVTLVRGAATSPHQVREPEYRVGYCQLEVEDPSARLKVEVAPAAADCRPGDTMAVNAQILDAAGQPVPDAEVTLYAVDEGVLALTDYATPDLAKTFLAPRPLGVASGISLPFLMTEDPEQLHFQNKGYLGGGGGREEIRHRFLACAFWNANLITDAAGKVSARFTAPDGLTRYRIIAVAHTVHSQFGSGSSAFAVSKPLIVEPAVPQFATIGDHLKARAVVLNQTDQAGDILVTLALDDKAACEPETNLSKRVAVTAHGSATVEFPVVFAATGISKWTWRARFAEPQSSAAGQPFTDAVQSSLTVGPVCPLLRETVSVRLDPGQTNLLAALNPQLLTGVGSITVNLANTRLVGLAEAIRHLLHYPYGCVEQTGSSLIPWILLRQTPALLPLTQCDGEKADAAAKAGIQRLFSMQTQSGGLSYWPGEKEPMLWGSAYGGMVLELARKAGLPVPKPQYEALLNYLGNRVRNPISGDADAGAQCLALYALALAGRAEPACDTQLFEERARLSAEERGLIAMAIAAESQTNTSPGAAGPGLSAVPAYARELLKPGGPGSPAGAYSFGCPAREIAIRLLAASACGADAKITEGLFLAVQAEQKNGQWLTTQGNAWVLLALHDYIRKTEADAASSSGALIWGDERKEFKLEPGCGLFSDSFALNPSRTASPLLAANSGGKPLFAQLTIESRLPVTNAVRQDHGLGLSRGYEKLGDDNEPKPADRLQVGDRVLVTLRLAVPEAAQYVVIDDPLPGVLEAANTEFKTQQVSAGNAPPAWMARNQGDPWWSDFQEIRADRVLFFRDHVLPGNYVIRYVARVRAAGSAAAPVAKAEEMYNPGRFGLTEAQSITSEPSE